MLKYPKHQLIICNFPALGSNVLFVGAVTESGPVKEVNVSYDRTGRYLVNYVVPRNEKALVFVKYGDSDIPGSPFRIRPKTHK